MRLDTDIFADVQAPRPAVERHAFVAAGVAVLLIVLLYWRTAASMIAIWWRSETFAHGFVVIPICLWLAWRRREALAQVEMKPWWPGLIGVSCAGALWLVSSAGDVVFAEQLALVFMIQAAIVTVVGLRMAWAIAFPLVFLLFAVPMGEFLLPTLIDGTADFTVGALRLSGVPVYREGNHFIIPSGMWSVVEACAGLRYLIASLMVGTLYAMMAYRSPFRRAAFIVASIIVPIVANWLRAYLIVMAAHLSSNKVAVGIDHIVYGWLFFGLVMLLLFWIGSFWQEPAAQNRIDPHGATTPTKKESLPVKRPVLAAAMAAIVAASLWLPAGAAIKSVRAGAPIVPAISGGQEWRASDASISRWKPHYTGFASERAQVFQQDGREVALYLAYYRGQDKGRKLVTSDNGLVTMSEWDWRLVSHGTDSIDWQGKRQAVDAAIISGSQLKLHVFRLYWIAGRVTASESMAKILTAWSVLTGRGDDSALIVMYAVQGPSVEQTRRLLRSFGAEMSPAIEQALAAARRGPG